MKSLPAAGVALVAMIVLTASVESTSERIPSAPQSRGGARAPQFQSQVPPLMDAEMAFFYKVAIHGPTPIDVDQYAAAFDFNGYHRAMPNEFERARYRAAIQAKISNAVSKISWADRF